MYLFLYKNFSNQKSSDVGIFFEIFVVICICCALLRFGCYFFCDVYVFASYISMFFAILFAFLYGILFAFLYFLEYLFLKEAQAHVFLQYFLQLFMLLPLSLSFLIVFYISFLYQTKKVQVNSKFHSFLKICFIISFFCQSSILFYIFPYRTLWFLIFNLLEALLMLILYSLVWINTLNQLDRFITIKIPKKYEWLLVYFLLEAFVMIFGEILIMIMNIVNYLIKRKSK